MTAAPTGPDPLSEEIVTALPEGTPVTVVWSGGNGPHDYVIAVDEHGSRYAWNGTEERLRWYNPLRFVGQERYHTRVWLAPTGPDPRTDPNGCPDQPHHGVDCPGDACRYAADDPRTDAAVGR